jgi:hypothetical protein
LIESDETTQVENIGHDRVVTSRKCGPSLVERRESASIAKEEVLISRATFQLISICVSSDR